MIRSPVEELPYPRYVEPTLVCSYCKLPSIGLRDAAYHKSFVPFLSVSNTPYESKENRSVALNPSVIASSLCVSASTDCTEGLNSVVYPAFCTRLKGLSPPLFRGPAHRLPGY